MKERSFVDTNILIYVDDADNPEKQKIAIKLLESGWHNGNAVLSTQVLQEYFSAVTRKLKLPADKAQRKIELLSHLEIASIEHADIVRAIELHRLHSFSFWDSLIVTMAQKTACAILYSEDMQDGRKLEGLRIVNPFKVLK
ncbi:MAG: PIN domain-containing protein [Cocleimonas sp.]|nr:PIN domain-containing protein [Cocleimonas sp.]